MNRELNEELKKYFDSIMQQISNEPETIELKRKIEELENRLSDDHNYMTTNANGDPVQAGGNSLRLNNYERTMAKLDNDIEELQSRALTLTNALIDAGDDYNNRLAIAPELETGAQQAQLTQDNDFIEEYRNLVDSNKAELAESAQNRRSYEEELDTIAEDLDKLSEEKDNITAEYNELKSRMEQAQIKDADGNVITDKKGNPLVAIDFNRKMADERRLKELQAEYDKFKTDILNSMVESVASETKDETPESTPVEASVEPTPAAPTESKSISEQYDSEGNLIPAEMVFNDEVLAGKYFEHPGYGKVEAMSNAVYSNGNVGIKTADGRILEVPLTELSLTDEFTPEAENKVSEAEKKAEAEKAQKEKEKADLKLKLDRHARWMAMYGKDKEDEKFMDGAAIDGLEKYGVYMPGGYTAKAENTSDVKVEEAPSLIAPILPVEEPEVEMEAMAANDVDTKKEETAPVVEATPVAEAAEPKEESEMDTMAKDNNKQVVDNYTEASDKQKSQAKVNFEKMKERLVAVGVAALIFVIGGKIMLNSSKDDTKDSNNEYTVESNTEDEIPEINTDEIVDEAIEEVAEEEEEVNENADEDKEAPKPSNTVQPNTPAPNTLLDQDVPVQGNVVAGGGATGVTEVDVTNYPTAEEIAQATAQINDGAPVGTVLATGQTILGRTEQTTGGEYTGTYEETVSGSERETLPDLETIDLDPGDDQIVWESSDGVQHVEDIPEGATSYQVEEIGHDEVIPEELIGLSQDELDAIAADQADANSLDEGGRSL